MQTQTPQEPQETWVRVLKKGIVTLPKAMREKAGIKEGDVAKATLIGNMIVIEPRAVVYEGRVFTKEKQRLHIFLQQGRLEHGDDPTTEEIQKYAQIIHPKDAPVIAAAVKNKVNILVTLDPTDFKKPAVRESVRPVEIMTPREVVTSVLPKMR